jgi:RNA polymerase sigma-70 factor, ECF subfamily
MGEGGPSSPMAVVDPPAQSAVVRTAPSHPISSADVFRDHGAFVFRLLRRLGVPNSDLDDVTQDVFVIVHRALGRTYEERNQMRSWLYRICVREACRVRRARKPVDGVDDVDAFAADSSVHPNPEEQVRRNEERADFDRLLSTLDDDRRAVFVLYEVEELPMEDVAIAVGCPVATAYSRLRSARKLVIAAAKRLDAQRKGAAR